MPKVLIIYYSKTGNTAAMAEAVESMELVRKRLGEKVARLVKRVA